MPDFKEIIRNASLDNIVAYIVNESEPLNGEIGISEEAIQDSYKEFMRKIVELYPSVNEHNNDLFDALTEFAAIHDETYFKLGVIVGAGLERELKEGYGSLRETEL